MRIIVPRSMLLTATAILALFSAINLGAQGLDQSSGSRIALVVGNSQYRYFDALPNPSNDAEDVSQALGDLGFDTTVLIDAGRRELYNAVRDFGDALSREKGIGLFYYAGHGVEVNGTNYLIPTDADIRDEDEVEFSAVPVDMVLAKMESAGNPTNMIFLDACRDNPLPPSSRTRGGERNRGLSPVDAPTGSLIVYATEPGATAEDGRGRNSPFTQAFLNHVSTPGVDVEIMLRNVRLDVIDATGGKQTPWTSSSLTQSVVLKGAPMRVRRAVGNLTVSTLDPGTLLIDGEEVAALEKDEEVTLENVPVGARSVVMRYKDHTEPREIEIGEGQSHAVSFSYEADPRFTLTVDPGISGLDVYIDGRRRGETPLEIELPAGRRNVQIRGDAIQTVYERIEGASRQTISFEPALTTYGTLRLQGDLPEGATVSVDGETRRIYNDHLRLPVGDHTVSITHDTIKPYASSVAIRYNRSTYLRPEIQYRRGSLRVTGIPDGTVVTVGGTRVSVRGSTVSRDELVIGRVPVVMQSRYGATARRTATIREDQTSTLNVDTGTLRVTGLPELVDLEINGEPLRPGRSGTVALSVLPAQYEVTVQGRWVEDLRRQVRVNRNSSVEVAFESPRYGTVSVTSPEDAQLIARLTGNANPPIDLEEGQPSGIRVPEGSYTLRARRSDDVDWAEERTVEVTYGNTARIDLSSIGYSITHRVGLLETRRAGLWEELERKESRNRKLTAGGWVGVGTGVLGTAIAAVSYFLGQQAYADYQAAATTADITAARSRMQTTSGLVITGSVLSGIGLSAWPIFWSRRPDTGETAAEIGDIQSQIQELEAQQ